MEQFTEQQIRTIAYLVWEAREHAEVNGTEDGDWYRAECMLRLYGFQQAFYDLAGYPAPSE